MTPALSSLAEMLGARAVTARGVTARGIDPLDADEHPISAEVDLE